jgi:hypothetical protein
MSEMFVFNLYNRTPVYSEHTTKISQQPENWENRNDPDLVQAFPKKWWVESDFMAPNLLLSLWFKGSGCHYNSIYNGFPSFPVVD